MICERCGRLLNRATGTCNVCADHGGAAPPPVATREAAAGPETAAAGGVGGVGAPGRDGGGPGPSLDPGGASPAGGGVRGPSRDPGEVGAAGSGGRGPSRDPGEVGGGPGPSSASSAGEPAPAADGPPPSVAATLRPASPYRLAPPVSLPDTIPPPRVAPLSTGAPAPAEPAAGSQPSTRYPDTSPPPDRAGQPTSRYPDTTPATSATPAAARDATETDQPLPTLPPLPEQPISVSAAVAILDLSDRPARGTGLARHQPSGGLEVPTTPTRLPGAPFGIVRSGRLGRRKVDLVAYDGHLVIAKRGAPDNLSSGQLAAQDASNRIVAADAVEEAIVREDAVSGQVRIVLRNGDDVVVRWPGWKNRGVSAENLLAHSFPGKVDQGSAEIAKRTVRVMMTLGVSILLAVAAYLGLSALLKGDPPPPPPPAPPTTLPAPEQAARTALQQACPPWREFAASVPVGERPNPTTLRPVVDGMRPWFVAAADAGADPIYAAARDEVGYLQEYARRPVADVARESVSRVMFAMRTVTSACDRAT